MKECHLEPQHAYVSGQCMCVVSTITKRKQQIYKCTVDVNSNLILLSPREHILSSPQATGIEASFKQIPMTENRLRHVFSQFSELRNQHNHHIIAIHFKTPKY